MPPSGERFDAAASPSPLRSRQLAGELHATLDALAGIGDALISVDLKGSISALNPVAERMTGWLSAEAVGRPLASVFQLVDEYTGVELESTLAPVLRAGTQAGHTGRVMLVARNGTRIAIEDSAAPIRDVSGNLCGAIVIFHDVSDRSRAHEALRAAERRTDQFLATLAHELRNPLAPIRQATWISRDPHASEDQKRWSLEVIERQVHNLSLLLDDLLDVARVTRGALALRVQLTELAGLVEAAVETARPQIDEKRHRLSVQIPPEPVRLCADPLRLTQILANLLTNAAKYTDPEGQIRLTASVAGEEIVIRVADTGVGIAAEALPRMFEMFAQVRARQACPGAGLGIGLALTKGLVELHGGRIEARSEGPGRGSEFTIWLPTHLSDAAQQTTASQAAALTPVVSRRVLIADDNQDSALTLAARLRLEGHEVAVVHDGPEALASFAAMGPDVVLLDIGMPGLNGYEVALRIRQRRGAGSAKLIAITGWGQNSDRERALAAGFDHHLTKPVDWQRVAELVRSAPRRGDH